MNILTAERVPIKVKTIDFSDIEFVPVIDQHSGFAYDFIYHFWRVS